MRILNFSWTLGLFLFSGLLACHSENKKEFVYCSEGTPSTFNPQRASDGTTFDASSQPIYNRLLKFKGKTLSLEPSLAKSWFVSKDGKEITFELRDDVEFQTTSYFKPSRKFNAEDVVFSFSKMMDPDHKFYKTGQEGYEYFESMGMRDVILKIEKISDFKIKFILKKPEAPFLSNLAMDFASILSKEYAEQLSLSGKVFELDSLPVGTGPFRLESYSESRKISYKPHEKYFLGKSEITKLTFLIVPSPSKRLGMLRKGKCHFVKNFASIRRGEFNSSDKVKLIKAPGLNVSYIGINLKLKKFQNKKLRKAMSLALNRTSYIDSIYLGNAVKAKSPIPPGIWAYDTKLKSLDYDLEEAKKLMKETGIDLPMQVSLWTLPVSRPYNPNGKLMGEMIKEDFSQIGINLSLVTFAWPTYLQKLKKSEYELVQYGWSSDNGDPDNFLHILLSCSGAKGGSNISNFCDKKYDDYVTSAKRTFSRSKRKELYSKALNLFQDEMPLLPIAHSNLFRVMSSDVEGYEPSLMGTESFYKVRLSSWK